MLVTQVSDCEEAGEELTEEFDESTDWADDDAGMLETEEGVLQVELDGVLDEAALDDQTEDVVGRVGLMGLLLD